MLHRIARVFDVVAWMEFAPYSKLLRQTADLSPQTLTPLAYTQEFDEEGEPMTSVDLHFDGSVICMSNYATAPTLLIQKTFESVAIANVMALRNKHD